MSVADVPDREPTPNGYGRKITLQTLAIIGGFFVQSLCFVWYGAQDDALLHHTVGDVSDIKNNMQNWHNDQSSNSVKTEARLSVIEVMQKEQGETMHRIENHLEDRKR